MTFQCKECNHRWNAKTVDTTPTYCPDCHTKYWKDERVETRGMKSRSSRIN